MTTYSIYDQNVDQLSTGYSSKQQAIADAKYYADKLNECVWVYGSDGDSEEVAPSDE